MVRRLLPLAVLSVSLWLAAGGQQGAELGQGGSIAQGLSGPVPTTKKAG